MDGEVRWIGSCRYRSRQPQLPGSLVEMNEIDARGFAVVGITIGGGIFRKPPTIAGLVPNPVVIIALWTAFGVISICGALAIAELSSLLPRPGGVYVFLREAYGDAAAFVFGWLYVLVTTPTTIAALGVVFAEFLLNLLGMSSGTRTVQ